MDTKNPIHINIKYSPEYDAIQVENALRNLEWFKKRYPDFIINLPEALKDASGTDSSQESILNAVRSEFDPAYYQSIEKSFRDEWEGASGEVSRSLRSIFTEIPSEYNVIITRYGIGGSYNPPNLVILNCEIYSVSRLIGVLIHEIVHIYLEPLIVRYDVQHDTKERLVDLIISRVLPDYSHEEAYSENESPSINTVFDKFYPDIEKIVSSINEPADFEKREKKKTV